MEKMTRRREVEAYWKNHIEACEESKQSKVVYAKSQELSYGRFLYWVRKLTKSQEPEGLTNWLPVKIAAPSQALILASVKMENGYCIEIHDIQALVYLLKKKR